MNRFLALAAAAAFLAAMVGCGGDDGPQPAKNETTEATPNAGQAGGPAPAPGATTPENTAPHLPPHRTLHTRTPPSPQPPVPQPTPSPAPAGWVTTATGRAVIVPSPVSSGGTVSVAARASSVATVVCHARLPGARASIACAPASTGTPTPHNVSATALPSRLISSPG